MRCQPCIYVGQYCLNWLNLLDHTLNTILLGDSYETVSARIARARLAGHAWAGAACKFLSDATYMVTFGKVNRDHCVHALDRLARPNSREIWNWNTNRFNPTPLNEVDPVDIGSTTE